MEIKAGEYDRGIEQVDEERHVFKRTTLTKEMKENKGEEGNQRRGIESVSGIL